MPEAARLYRENIALKTQLDVVEARLKREEADVKPRPRRPLRERGAQELRMPPHSRVDSANMENRPARSPIKPS